MVTDREPTRAVDGGIKLVGQRNRTPILNTTHNTFAQVSSREDSNLFTTNPTLFKAIAKDDDSAQYEAVCESKDSLHSK